MTLSILIPTLIERHGQCNTLWRRLKTLSKPYDVEILINEDNREKATGAKRNELVERANGLFSAFIDDDDNVPDYYFDSIFRALGEHPKTDCIGFKGLFVDRGNPQSNRSLTFRHSKGLPYTNGHVKGEYLRPPTHINPMLTEYFKAIRFPNKTIAEDFEFALKLAEADLIKNETFLDVVMYHYYFNPKK